MEKVLMIILDGLGDLPIEELGNKTPLEAANTPNLDRLAQNGICGLMQPAKGVACESDVGHLSIFGYDIEKYYCGRGPLEALGLGFDLKEDDIAFRTNFGTLDKTGKIVDRRAGRIESVSELAKSLDGKVIENCTIHVIPGIRHRSAVVIRGPNLGSNVSDTDSEIGESQKACYPKDNSAESKKTANIINKFSEFAKDSLDGHEINKERIENGLLPANCILLRGAGKYKKPVAFEEKYNMKAVSITEGGLYGGIGKFLSMDAIKVDGVNDKFDSNIEGQIAAAIDALKKYEFIFMHVKPTDVFGHDGKFVEKTKFIERFDKHIQALHNLDALIVVTADHSTPCKLKAHSSDPVPILFYGKDINSNEIKKFSEKECNNGLRLQGKDVMPMVIKLLGRKS